MASQEIVKLERDTLAVAVPSGQKVMIGEGSQVALMQALGGSFTVTAQGRMFRISGEDADALGKTPPPPPQLPENASDEDVEQLVWEQMRTCYDPEIPINIVELGLIYSCTVEKEEDGSRSVWVEMTLTAPGCGMGDTLANDVWQRIMEVPTVEQAGVEMVFDPPWDASRMSEAARLETGMF
ncbi:MULTISPECIES: putative Fe-S cluster assembly protein SufT [unclassified Thioalkalivibrio]|uniref:putative Fe-S cluster assembly protein SufT n=1 Tax=unclassified Thioalkalivibrio TaxID=2621013 RepID=UPI0003765A2D|nr:MULTISPECIES: putative Fe-S cluster assembly protein SufT [unclassified Thioalkalivibrio]PYG04515.1 putative FeS assembly SUF system protein SufT [Thioalkalivibrio sp. ALE21]